MTACVANYWLFIIVFVIFILLLLFRQYFLHSGRNIQRLEALGKYYTYYIYILLCFICIARSPIYSHISSTIQGLSTIRAYKEQVRFLNSLHFYQNEHAKAWYTKLLTNRWFGMRLDMFGVVFIAFLVFTSIPLSDGNISTYCVYVVIYICMYAF